MGIGSFPGVKQPVCDADDLNTTSDEVVNRSELYLRLSSVPKEACHGVTFTFKQTL